MKSVFATLAFGFIIIGYLIIDKLIFEKSISRIICYDKDIYPIVAGCIIAIIVSLTYESMFGEQKINPKKALEAGLNNPSFAKYHQENNDDMVNLQEIAIKGEDPLKQNNQKQKSKKKPNLGVNKNASVTINKGGQIIK